MLTSKVWTGFERFWESKYEILVPIAYHLLPIPQSSRFWPTKRVKQKGKTQLQDRAVFPSFPIRPNEKGDSERGQQPLAQTRFVSQGRFGSSPFRPARQVAQLLDISIGARWINRNRVRTPAPAALPLVVQLAFQGIGYVKAYCREELE